MANPKHLVLHNATAFTCKEAISVKWGLSNWLSSNQTSALVKRGSVDTRGPPGVLLWFTQQKGDHLQIEVRGLRERQTCWCLHWDFQLPELGEKKSLLFHVCGIFCDDFLENGNSLYSAIFDLKFEYSTYCTLVNHRWQNQVLRYSSETYHAWSHWNWSCGCAVAAAGFPAETWKSPPLPGILLFLASVHHVWFLILVEVACECWKPPAWWVSWQREIDDMSDGKWIQELPLTSHTPISWEQADSKTECKAQLEDWPLTEQIFNW